MVDNLPPKQVKVVEFVTPPGAMEVVRKCRQFRVSGSSVVRGKRQKSPTFSMWGLLVAQPFQTACGEHYRRRLRLTLSQTVYPVYRAALSQTVYRVTSSQVVYRVTFSQTAYRVTLSQADDIRGLTRVDKSEKGY